MVGAPDTEPLFLGIDGGGSKCKACLADASGRVLSSALAGPANPFHGLTRALTSITGAARSALTEAGLPDCALSRLVVGAGLAGVNLPGLYREVADWGHPFAEWHLATDLRIACLGAHQRDEGAVIVIGTGSCGYVRAADGAERLIGGHGFPFGDQGSGAWMGLEAVKAVLLAEDQLGPETALTERVAERFNARGLAIIERLSGGPSSDYARLAPLVFDAAEAGDSVARGIVAEGASYISDMARQLLARRPVRLALVGGVAERLRPWLDATVCNALSEPLGAPEEGALRFAREQHAGLVPA